MALPATENFSTASDPLASLSSWTQLPVVSDSGQAAAGVYKDNSGNSSDKAAYWNADTFSDDQYSQIEVANFSGSNTRLGVIVRASTSTNVATLIRLKIDGNFEAYVWDSGGSRNALTGNPYTPSATVGVGDIIRAEIDSATDTLTLKIDYGAGFVTETTWDASSGNASGQTGLYIVDSLEAMRGDNWEGGDLASGSFTLVGDSGAYSYSGTNATLAASKIMSANSASYVSTGTNAALNRGFKLISDSVAYSYSGTNSDLYKSSKLTADSGSYAYTGTSASVLFGASLIADSESYAYTGTTAALTFASAGNFTLSADNGAYSYSGTIAALTVDRVLVSSSGAYTYSGTAATLSPGFSLAVDSGNYAYSGANIDFSKTSVLNAVSGNYVYNGSTVSLTYTPIGPDIPTAEGLTVGGSFGNGVSFTASFGSGVAVKGNL